MALSAKNGLRTAAPRAKVVASAGGAAGTGTAALIVANYILDSYLDVQIPPDVLSAALIVLSALGAFLSGYFARPGADEGILPD